MSQDTETMELRVSTSPNVTHNNDTITLRAENGKRPTTASKYITCIASDEMRITGSGELNHSIGNKRVSWNKLKADAQYETNLSNTQNKTDIQNGIVKDDNQMELESMKEEINSNTPLPNNEQSDVEMLESNENEIIYGKVDTPPLSNTPTTTRNRDGSKGNNGMVIRMSGGVELEDIMLQAREGIGGNNRLSKQVLKVSAILHHAPQPPSSPPHLPLKSGSNTNNNNNNNNNNNRKSIKKEEIEDIKLEVSSSEEEGRETEEEVEGASKYEDVAGYNSTEEKGHVEIEIEGGELEVEGERDGMVGMTAPKQDRMVRKEIVQIGIVALIAVIVVLVFVFT